MDDHQKLLSRLAQPARTRIVLIVLDGVGDISSAEQSQTALEKATTPHFDDLAGRSSQGRLTPVATGITPGSGPGHLALFGYDPTTSEADIGRGVLEALGLGLDIGPDNVAARGNFATVNQTGELTDRRAGRIPTAECVRLCAKLSPILESADLGGVKASIHPGEGYRFVVLFKGPGLHAAVADTDPQKLGVPPLPAQAVHDEAETTAAAARRLIEILSAALADEPKANSALLRGFSQRPHLPKLGELYGLRSGAFAGYPLYRGVAGACGMKVIPCGARIGDILPVVAEHWDEFDFFFVHVKQTDQAGEDGNLDAKVSVIEEVDAVLPDLLALGPDVIAVTADHSTPAPMKAHSWHPMPLLIHAKHCLVDKTQRFHEHEAVHGTLGTLPSRELMGLLLAHAGRLKKFGA